MKLIIIKLLFITLGAFLAAASIDCFLIPNKLIDGGIVGLAMMASYVFKPSLSVFIILFNIPFIILAYKRLGKRFLSLTVYAVSVFAVFTTLIHRHLGEVTHDLILASVFGGFFLGLGVGLILRNNASLDGTEILALCFNKRFGVSVGEIIMFINVFIFFCAGLVFGWDRAMYSALAYIIAYNVIDAVLQGLSESKSLFIVSDKYKELGDYLMQELNVVITYIGATGGYLAQKKEIIYCVVPRVMIIKIKEAIATVDPEAFLAIENVHEVEGKNMRRKHM